jgi:hypothetical protein
MAHRCHGIAIGPIGQAILCGPADTDALMGQQMHRQPGARTHRAS